MKNYFKLAVFIFSFMTGGDITIFMQICMG